MHPFIIYIIRSVAIAGIFYAYYFLLLRNKKLHGYNRFFILTSILLSLLIPLLHIGIVKTITTNSSPAIKLLNVINASGYEPATVASNNAIPVEQILWTIYFAIGLVMLSAVVVKVFGLYNIMRRSLIERSGNINIVYTDHKAAPFSFLNNIFWKSDIDMESATGKSIMQHELVHIRQWHTLDKLLMKMVLSFFWMNPFYWLFQKELSMVHEFSADEGCIEDNDTSAFAAMLLQSHFGNRFTGVIQPFFYSPVKRRLTMLQQTNKTKYVQLRRLLVLPVVSATVLLFSFSVKEKPTERTSQNAVLVIDAGHGGNDNGATNASGVKEKDLNLRIARVMAKVAKEYSIDAVLTRSDDDYPTLSERANMAAENHADVFISLHVNNDTKGEVSRKGVEVYVSEKSVKYNDSKLLASAIIGKLGNASATLKNKGLVVLRENTVPAVLIECGNIDDAKDMAMLQDDAQLETFCRKVLAGVVQYKNQTHK